MKNFLIIITIVSFPFFSCTRLDIAPRNIIQEQEVFSSETGIDAYLASLYNSMKVEDFFASWDDSFRGWEGPSVFSGETCLRPSNEAFMSSLGNGNYYTWWGYNSVRNVNAFSSAIQKYAANYSTVKVNQWLGEARFLRAWYYFTMVKRYGGIPIIKEVQNYSGDVEPLRVPRNKEKEVYDFIEEDLNEAINLLPAADYSGKTRATKIVAQALKSRVMLYAGSIAKYGKVQLDGLLGIPASEANSYFQKSLDASKAIVDVNNIKSKLYPDYGSMFITPQNHEYIFIRAYIYPNKVHSWDSNMMPWGVKSPNDAVGLVSPTLDLIERYEYVDGSPGQLKITDNSGNQIKYNHPSELFAGKDPRMFATVVYPYDTYKGTVIQIRKGIIINGKKLIRGQESLAKAEGFTGGRVDAFDGIGEANRTMSGFYIRKFVQVNIPSSELGEFRSTTPWPIFRYGEIALNLSEAAFELGQTGDALLAINAIRERAGIRILTSAELTLDRIRNERRVELALENHTYWDLRRWRTFDTEFDNVKVRTLLPYYNVNENKYVFEVGTGSFQYKFDTRLYYNRIPETEIAKNPKLVQNIGY